jgi:hypothetical protein
VCVLTSCHLPAASLTQPLSCRYTHLASWAWLPFIAAGAARIGLHRRLPVMCCCVMALGGMSMQSAVLCSAWKDPVSFYGREYNANPADASRFHDNLNAMMEAKQDAAALAFGYDGMKRFSTDLNAVTTFTHLLNRMHRHGDVATVADSVIKWTPPKKAGKVLLNVYESFMKTGQNEQAVRILSKMQHSSESKIAGFAKQALAEAKDSAR